MKAVAEALGVSRSNLVERLKDRSRPRRRHGKAEDAVLLPRIRHLVEAAGGTMNDVVKLGVFTTDISERMEISRARREFFTGDFPCATLVEVRALVDPKLLVEIEAIAVIGAGAR